MERRERVEMHDNDLKRLGWNGGSNRKKCPDNLFILILPDVFNPCSASSLPPVPQTAPREEARTRDAYVVSGQILVSGAARAPVNIIPTLENTEPGPLRFAEVTTDTLESIIARRLTLVRLRVMVVIFPQGEMQ